MRTLKSLSRRSLALLLTLVMMTGMVNLSAFAADEPQQDWDESFQLPNPQEVAMQIEALNQEIEELDPEAADYEAQLAQLQEQLATLEMLQYPMEDGVLLAMDGRGYENFGQLLLAVHPKNGVSAPVEGGVWSAEGQWEEDGSDVLTMSEDGRAVINEPKGPAGRVTVKYTYTHEVEITAPAADTAPKADAAPEAAAPVEGEGDKAEAPADGEQKAEGAEPQEPSEPAEGDQEQGAADVNPDEENSGEEPAPEIAPDQEEDAEGAGEAENNGEEPAPEVVPAEDNTAEDQGEADAETPENAETAPETSEGKNGEEGDEGEDGVQPEPSEPAEEEPAEDPSEEVPATTTQQVEETLTWTVVFTSEVEPLSPENEIANFSDLKAKLKTAGTYKLTKNIKVKDTVTVNKNVTLNLNGKTLSYADGTTGNMFEVDAGGTFTITGTGTIQGTGTAEKGNTGSLVLVNGGTFILQGGTLKENHKGTVPTNVIQNTDSDYKIRSNPENFSGAGVYVKSGTFKMTGGTISDNHTIYTNSIPLKEGVYSVEQLPDNAKALQYYYTLYQNEDKKHGYRFNSPLGQGGGVFVEDGTFILNGENAVISKNHASEGGGVFVKGGTFTMKNGKVDGNVAHLGEGGGIYIQASTTSSIEKGFIENNVTETTEDLGGGGIYVENSGKLTLSNAEITNNTAQGLGGGIAACIHGKFAIFASNGAKIYGNHIPFDEEGNLTGDVGYAKSMSMTYKWMAMQEGWWKFAGYNVSVGNYGTYFDSYHLWHNDESFQKAARDIFSAGGKTTTQNGVIVSNQMFDGLANWTGFTDGTPVNAENDDVVISKKLLGLTANPNPAPTIAASVFIRGNTSKYTHGGGLANNGTVEIGTKAKAEPNPVELQISKTFDGPEKTFTFGLFEKDGTTPVQKNGKNVTATLKASSSKDGKATLTIPASAFTKIPGENVFKVKEITPETADGVEYDPTVYEVKVTVTNETKHQTLGDSKYTVTTREAHLTSVSPTPNTTDNVLTFNNKVKRGSLVLNKNLVLEDDVKLDSDPTSWTFQITLVDEKGNAVSGKRADGTIFNSNQTVEVTRDAPVTISDIPVGTKYTVTEVNKDTTRYVTSDEVTDARTIVAGSNNSVTIKNERLYGDLTVTKTVDWDATTSNKPNENDEFTIVVNLGEGGAQVEANAGETKYQGQGVYTFTLKGGENGQPGKSATITGIPTGIAYTVSETDLPKGYTNTNKDQLPNGVKLTEDASVNVQNHYFKSLPTNITVEKTWYPVDTKLASESITVELLRDGILYEEFTLNNENEWKKTWTLDRFYRDIDGTEKEYVYSIKETEIDYGKGEILENVLAELNKTGKTSKSIFGFKRDGSIIKILGDATIAETGEHEVLGGFRVSGETADVDADGNRNFKLTNSWIPAEDIGDLSLELTKVEELNNSTTALSGAQFELEDQSNGNKILSELTDANGMVTIDGLKEGTYTLKETKAPTGYRLPDQTWEIKVTGQLVKVTSAVKETATDGEKWINQWKWSVTKGDEDQNVTDIADSTAQIVHVQISNSPILGNIEIRKALNVDGISADLPMANKEFSFNIYKGEFTSKEQLKDQTPVNAKPLTVAMNSENPAKIENLRFGKYTIVEVEDNLGIDDYQHTGVTFNGKKDLFVADIQNNGATINVTATNSYKHDTGSLSVGKTVVGVPTDEAFQFEVKLTLPEAYVAAGMNPNDEGKFTLPVSGVAQENIEFTLNGLTAVGTVNVAHEQTAKIEGIPTHAKYEVNELNRGKYEETHGEENANKGTIEITEANAEANYKVSFTNTQWIGTSVNLGVRKILSYQDIDNMSMVNRQFTFELFQLEEDNGSVKETKVGELTLRGSEFNPAPAGSFKLDYSHELNDLDNGKSQTFVYEIREVETAGQGYIWAPRMGVEVTVSVENGQYRVDKVVYGRDDTLTEAIFNNKINVFQGDKGKIQLGGLKNLNGSPSDRAFDFTLTDVTDPENPVLLETVQNAVSAEDRGVFKFAEIELSAAGMTAEKYQVKNAAGDVESYQYKYEIREVSEGAGNLHIDRTVYTVIVDVKDIDGVMQVQKYTYIPVDAEGVEGDTVESDKPETIVFNNILTPPPPTDPPTTPDRPTTPPDEPVPDPEVPLTPGPEPEPTPEEPTPEVEIPGDDVPLAPAPEIPEEVVFDEDVPLAAMPPEEEIFDGDVPLANVPKTGDATGLWAALTALSGASLAALGLTKKRKDEDDEQA